METQVSCSYLSSQDSWVTSLYTVAHAVVDLVSYSICTGFSDFFQFPPASAAHCKAQLSIFAQVDDVGNAWVAGATYSSLDGHANAGREDIFLMKFDAQGVHLRASAVVRAVTTPGLFRRTGCDFVFESVPWRKNMEKF